MTIMEMIERAISVRRLGETQRARYRVLVEGVMTEPVLLTGSQLGHVLGLILGEDVAVPFKQLADDDTSEFNGRPWLTRGQDDALRVLITAYGSAKTP